MAIKVEKIVSLYYILMYQRTHIMGMNKHKRNRVENLEMDPNSSQNLKHEKRHFKLVLNRKDELCMKVVLGPLNSNIQGGEEG